MGGAVTATDAGMAPAGSPDEAPAGPRRSWWFTPMPRNRVAVLRTIAYLFIPLDLFVLSSWTTLHGRLDGDLYRPLQIGRLLPLPTPDQTVVAVTRWGLVIAIVLALSGRLPRTTGWVIAVLYLEWSVIGMSYGKVDHDRLGFHLLLFVLPTIGAAHWRDRTPDAAAGWIMRMAQVAAVATYFLAAVAKVRYGGWEWVDSSTMLRAVLRRGTSFGDWFGDHPETLHVLQYLMLIGEFASPVLLVDGRLRRFGVYVAYLFHLGTYAALTIAFFPHLVTLLSFLQLERLADLIERRWAVTPAPVASAAAGG
jgi:hypothetical protein